MNTEYRVRYLEMSSPASDDAFSIFGPYAVQERFGFPHLKRRREENIQRRAFSAEWPGYRTLTQGFSFSSAIPRSA
jgi:hypothetical protein